jgi:transposase
VPFIQETFARYPTLRASRLYQMVRERGYLGGPHHFRHMVARWRPRPAAEAYLRLRTLPAEQSQIDWAHFGKLAIGRAQRPMMAFVMVLSYSRHLFVRFYLNASTGSFLDAHVRAFAYFTAVPRVCLYDNLRSAVLERSGDAIRFNPTLLELAASYRFQPRPVAVARGNENAFAERFVRSIKSECLSKLIPIGAPMLRRALGEYMDHYHLERNHQGLDNNLIESAPAHCSKTEQIDCRSRLGGILRFYERAAA